MRALIVDDSQTMRAILRAILKRAGFEVREAVNGKEALGGLGPPGEFRVAFVDWKMPEMDGFEFVRAVRADSRYADLSLVMLTSETEVSQVALALEAGANEYVMKPFTREILLDKLGLLGILEV